MTGEKSVFAPQEKHGYINGKIVSLSREVEELIKRKERTGRIPYSVLIIVIRNYYGLSELIADSTAKDSTDRKELRGRLDEVRSLLVKIGAL